MIRAIRWIQNYLLIALPFMLICMGWGASVPENEIMGSQSFFLRAAWEILSWNLILWFLLLIVFLVSLAALPEAREKTLRRIANIKDRDEREEIITGRAAKATYIAMLSALMLFLFLSLFQFNVYRVPQEKAINGKSGTMSLTLNFKLWDESATTVAPEAGREDIFDSRSYSPSAATMLLILLAWQLISFNVSARRESQL